VESSIVASTSSPFGRADGGVAVLIFEPDRPSHVHQVGPSVVISVYNTGSLFQRRSVFSVRLWWPGCQHAASDRHRYAEVPTARRTDLCSSAPSQPPLLPIQKKSRGPGCVREGRSLGLLPSRVFRISCLHHLFRLGDKHVVPAKSLGTIR